MKVILRIGIGTYQDFIAGKQVVAVAGNIGPTIEAIVDPSEIEIQYKPGFMKLAVPDYKVRLLKPV